MLTYKFTVSASLLLMLTSGFLRGFVDCFNGCFLEMFSNTAGWVGAFLLGYSAPTYTQRHWWFFAAGGTGIIGFWVTGYVAFCLIAYSF